MKTISQLIKDYQKEIEELEKIKVKNNEFSFHWSMAEGAMGECRAILSDLKMLEK